MINSDGSVDCRSGNISYFTTSKFLADQIQQLCLHIGLCANIKINDNRERSFGDRVVYVVGIISRELKPEINKFKDHVGKSYWVDDWEGEVVCAQVPNNTLYVRRNGKPVWCGNSVLEHCNFNFAIWAVSRSLTHELVRHRVGFSYSQISQRYVDSSNTAFVVPPAIQELEKNKATVYQKWLDHMVASQDLYSELTEVLSEMYQDIDDKTEKRKKARQAARSVLPNATETKIFVTCNGRAVRHFIEMRANPAADLEIRMLAVDMFKIMEKEFPLIVYGMKVITLEDGTFGIESSHRKV